MNMEKGGIGDHKQQLDTKFAFMATYQPIIYYNKDSIINYKTQILQVHTLTPFIRTKS